MTAVHMHLYPAAVQGDIRRPLRLLVSGGAISIWAEEGLAQEADLIAQMPERLAEILIPRMEGEGYFPEPYSMEPIACFAARIPPPGGGQAIRITASDLPSELTHPLTEISAHTAYGIILQGRLAAAAWAQPTDDHNAVEIAVETAPGRRRRGYAYSAAGALINQLLREGREVCYRCAERNAASMSLAQALCLSRVGSEYYPAFRRRSL